MDDLVDAYIDDYISEEMAIEVRRSLSLFDFYGLDDAVSKLNDVLILDQMEEAVNIYDGFFAVLEEQLRAILKAHTYEVAEDATIYQLNELLTALARIQYREDYSNYLRILEGFESDEEQLTEILADMCDLSQIELMTLIVGFEPSSMKVLKDYMYQKEADRETEEPVKSEILKNLKLFFKADDKKQSIGQQLIEMGLLIGAPFTAYIPYITDVLGREQNFSLLALHILSVLYMSEDGYTKPIETFREHSLELLGTLDRTTGVETKLIEQSIAFNDFVKAENEKARLSQSSIKA